LPGLFARGSRQVVEAEGGDPIVRPRLNLASCPHGEGEPTQAERRAKDAGPPSKWKSRLAGFRHRPRGYRRALAAVAPPVKPNGTVSCISPLPARIVSCRAGAQRLPTVISPC